MSSTADPQASHPGIIDFAPAQVLSVPDAESLDLRAILEHTRAVEHLGMAYGDSYRDEMRAFSKRAIDLALKREELLQELWKEGPRG